ncbi:protein of unknown function [Microbulbifer donghaiensis]|uniref:DUF3291 domain-containing protein n=1 Tax=Microbulbifer donghaiensis TaxID=494016 RepID=A0A1M4YM97_9GAMM|nr:DUF3291 domain-containing protein [Microbulbifer donghaiensis]SHF06788.1 protein of unknown function [Microbulbifer donghaiensis]
MSAQFHLAQVNIARAKGPMDSPVMRGFVEQLDRINALADRSPGFVWRLQTEEGDATALQVFEDERIIVNLSVWASIEALKDYVYSGEHLEILKDKKRWFEKMPGPILALWWIPAGTLPTVDDARQALQTLSVRGPSTAAFSFARPFPAPQMLPA